MLKKLFSQAEQQAEPPKRGASATVHRKTEPRGAKKRFWRSERSAVADERLLKQKSKASADGTEREPLAATEETARWHGIDGDWWIKPATILTALAVFIALGNYCYSSLYHWLDQPVEWVTFEGNTEHLDRTQLAASSVALMKGGLLSADLDAVKAGIQKNPWVYQVGVSRRWPASLYLQIKEEVPVARWGDDALLNHEGDIFWPDQVARYSTLPLLTGPSGNTAMMMSEYYDLNQMLRNAGLQLVELKLEARGAWTLMLNNGIKVVVGRDQVVARLERFLTVYQQRLQAEADAGRIEQIDIRYNNGIAVKWRPEAATDEQQKG
ncbi:cell division protein FtsQ/DivIB [Amphritea pacifica]|uniref:cell division protein FtsQ/DivIB n=1 Tax=Amphritea pacifica TaxID=2811233 RepID=UPI00196622E7|nr:cell division protein FtsQ/DivIB [Amphritea pacifica]MBN1007705.1 cell division protein FtsQ/DivIB [Amphritea pacifica]